MKLILQAIEALFRKTRIDNETIRAEIDMTQEQIQEVRQEAKPLVITVGYDPEFDGSVADIPFKEIEKAYKSGKLVILKDVGLPTEFTPGERIRFTSIEWNTEYAKRIHHYIHADGSYNMDHSIPIKLT